MTRMVVGAARSLPRIYHGHASGREIADVAGGDCHPVHERRRGDQRISVGLRVGNMQLRTSNGDLHVDGKDSTRKSGQRH